MALWSTSRDEEEIPLIIRIYNEITKSVTRNQKTNKNLSLTIPSLNNIYSLCYS
jgi:hypothetical protein